DTRSGVVGIDGPVPDRARIREQAAKEGTLERAGCRRESLGSERVQERLDLVAGHLGNRCSGERSPKPVTGCRAACKALPVPSKARRWQAAGRAGGYRDLIVGARLV